MLLVSIEKFETNPMLVNVNKLKPYKYMESKVQKKKKKNKKKQMHVYWEKNVGGIQEANSNTDEDDECEVQKPHMKNVR